MSMVNADSVQLFAMLKKMQDSISSIETTKKSVKMKYEQLVIHGRPAGHLRAGGAVC